MPQFNFSSRYYAEDKDIYDLLKASAMTLKQLVRIARKRGIFLSEQESKEDVLQYVSNLPYSWPQLQELMDEISTEDRLEKSTTLRLPSQETIAKLKDASDFVQNLRSISKGEIYSTSETKDGKLQIKVKYTDFDPKTTRLLQRRKREVTIEAEKVGDRFEIRHDHTARAVEIAERIVEAFTSDKEAKPTVEVIDLSGVTDPNLRTRFFTNLFSDIDGFRFVDVKDIKVDRLPPDDDENESDDSTDDSKSENEKPTEQELKSWVKKMLLTGDGLLYSPEYKQLRKNGFFITKAAWLSRENIGAGRDVLFSAEFSGEADAHSFVYDVRWVWERDEDGDLRVIKTALSAIDRAIYIRKLENAAFKSLGLIKEEIENAQKASSAVHPQTAAPPTPKDATAD